MESVHEIKRRNFLVRRLQAADIDRTIQLHEEAIHENAKIGKGVLIGWHGPSYFEENVSERGFMLGCFHDGIQIGYGSARFPGAAELNFGRFINLPEDELAHVAHLNGAYIGPAFRGFGLHRVMAAEREQHIFGLFRKRHLLVEIHILNKFSLYNQFPAGLVIKSVTVDGPDHYFLFHKDCRTIRFSRDVSVDRLIPVSCIEEHQEVLRRGFWGVSAVERGGDVLIGYVRSGAIEDREDWGVQSGDAILL